MRWLYAGINLSFTTLLMLAVLCALAQPARAYVDPGSGLLAVQIIGTTFAGMIFMLRRRVQAFFRSMTVRFGSKSGKDAE